MKKRRYLDENAPVGHLTVIPDFLPPPEELALPFKKQKITILLEKWSIDFYKEHAKRLGIKYQQFMREVLSRYAQHHAVRRPR